MNQIPRRLEVSDLEGPENRLDTIDVSIIVLLNDGIQLGLKGSAVDLLLSEQRESRGRDTS